MKLETITEMQHGAGFDFCNGIFPHLDNDVWGWAGQPRHDSCDAHMPGDCPYHAIALIFSQLSQRGMTSSLPLQGGATRVHRGGKASA